MATAYFIARNDARLNFARSKRQREAATQRIPEPRGSGTLGSPKTPLSPRELTGKAVAWVKDNGSTLNMLRSAVLPALGGAPGAGAARRLIS